MDRTLFLFSSHGKLSRTRVALREKIPRESMKPRHASAHVQAWRACSSTCSHASLNTVTFRDQKILARPGEKLRDVLLDADASALTPHNGKATFINCRGLGTCGTCAVSVVAGIVSPAEISLKERARLSFPPHNLDHANKFRLRLACQVHVSGDVELRKFNNFWGQGNSEQAYPSPD